MSENYVRFSKLCYFFFKLCSLKNTANKSKNTFSLIRSRSLAIVAGYFTLLTLMNLTLPLRGFSVTINYNRNYNYKIIKITIISITMIKNYSNKDSNKMNYS